VSRVVTFGETMGLGRATELGTLAQVGGLRLGIGGAESNVGIALSRLGTSVIWFGRVGADGLGERVVRELRAEGVDVRATVDRHSPTGFMLRELRTPDSARVYYYRTGSAGSGLRPDDLDFDAIAGADLLHLTGITLALSDSASAAAHAAVDAAKSAGVPVSFDVNHRPSLWIGRDASPVYREIAARADIVFAGEEEAQLVAAVTGPPSELAFAIADLGPTQVLIKLGADGCLALVDGTLRAEAAVAIRPMDTVGAGDGFVAGYLAELLDGRTVSERLRTAVVVGAFACLNPGDWEGYPHRHELGLLHATEPVTR
jgi:2-dehydro-3-deoxygluconokinase